MRKIVAPSLALLASAAVVFAAACSRTNDGPTTPGIIASGAKPANSIADAAAVQVCLGAGSSPGVYTFTPSAISNAQPGDAANTVVIDNTTPGPVCGNVLARTPPGDSPSGVSSVTITASTAAGGAFAWTCVNDADAVTCLDGGTFVATPAPNGSRTGTGATSGTAAENAFHGSVVTFTFTAHDAPPPPPPPPPPPTIGTPIFVIGDVEAHDIDATVNFWGAQWSKNNTLSGLVSNGIAGSFKGYAETADDFCGGHWTSRVGNSPPPPATIGSTINIIVSSTIQKNGPNITGDILQILTVTVGPGYSNNPGHAGNGVVTTLVCPTDHEQ